MNYLVVYPHCYTTQKGKSVFILNPETKEYIIFKSDLSFDGNPMLFPLFENTDICEFACTCKTKGLGYIVENLNVMPYVKASSFRFISSIPKIKKALGYNDGFKVLDYITTINIHVPSKNKTLQYEDYYIELDYPKPNDYVGFFSFLNSYYLPNIDKIILSGDLDKNIIDYIRTIYPNVCIEYRTIVSKETDISFAEDLAKKFKYFIPSLYIPSNIAKSLSIAANKANLCKINPLIENVEDLTQFEDYICNLFYSPLLHSTKQDIIPELTFDKKSIVYGNYDLDSLLKNEFCNQHLYGSITLTYDGDISIGNQNINNISNDWLPDFMTFIYKEFNSWNETRNNKPECKNCLFHALCPPISVYERLGFIEKACND